jgi:hypothetical protein
MIAFLKKTTQKAILNKEKQKADFVELMIL